MWAPWTADDVVCALKDQEGDKALGPDAWSLEELLLWPASAKEGLAQLFNRIEFGGEQWPRLWTLGATVYIPKKEVARSVKDLRPIALLSMIYRCWSSRRSKQILQWCSSWAPAGCRAYLRQRETSDVVMTVCSSVENVYLNGGVASGIVMDVVKASEFIQRPVILSLSKKAGLPDSFASAWVRMLGQISRRVRINGHLGGEFKASVGIPEVMRLAWWQ